MKEQILTILSSRAERGDLIKEIASSHATPRNDKLLSLTSRLFPPTLKIEGDIFMPEPGQGETTPANSTPRPPELPKPRTEIGPGFDQPQEPQKPISPERVAKVRELWDRFYLRGRDLSSLPHDERQAVESAIKLGFPPIAGGQEAVVEQPERIGVDEATRRLEEAARQAARGRVAAGGPLFPDVQSYDPRLQPIAERINRLRLDDPANIEGNMQVIRGEIERIGNIASESGVVPELVSQAARIERDLYDVYNGLLRIRSGQIEERERYGIFRERRLEPQEKEAIRNAVLGLTEQEMRAVERILDWPSPDMTEQQIQERREEIRVQRERLRNVERIFNRMFENVDANPKLQFQESFSAGQYEYLEFVQTINEALANAGDVPDAYQVRQQILRHLRGYVEERKLRQAAHDVNYVVVADLELDQLVGFVRGFQAEQADLAFSKTGVSTVLHFYEQALLKVREENDGYIPTYSVVGEAREGSTGRVEQLTRNYIREAIRVGTLPQMEDWEINRAISLARGMGIINGRLMEIAATSKLPGEPERGAPFAPRVVNVYAQKIIASMSPFKHLVYKYDVYGERNRVFAFFLNRGNRRWDKKELEGFEVETMLDVVNGLVEDKDARFLSVLNPFRLGGIFSRTTWRLSQDPVVGAIGDFEKENPENRNWIGTGAIIEIERGNLNYLDPKNERHWARDENGNPIMENGRYVTKGEVAERRIRDALQKISRIQPLKLFYNLKGPKDKLIPEDLQKHVLSRLGKEITGDRLIDRDEVLRGDLDTLAVLQEKALRDALNSPDKQVVPLVDIITADAVGPPEQRLEERQAKAERLRAFVDAVQVQFTQPQDRFGRNRSHLDKFVEDLRDREWKIPFNIGTDDVPYEEYKFAKTGSDSFQRRWNDMGQGKKATDVMLKLVENMSRFRRTEEIFPYLDELYNSISYYDEGIAREVVAKFAEGIIKFYKKDWYARLPLFIGTAANIAGTITGRGSSFSELAFGKGQMSFDETDISGFTSQLRERGDINIEQMNEIRQKAGGHKRELVYAYARLLVPILAIAFAYYMTSRAVRGRE